VGSTTAATGRSAIVTGARGLVGRRLLPRLLAAGFEVQAVSRRPAAAGPGLRWLIWDLRTGEPHPAPAPGELLVHAAPLWLLPPLLPRLQALGVRRLLAFSSTSRYTKAASPSARERELARALTEAEAAVSQACLGLGVRFTILRPTLVYDRGRDRNVSDIARLARRLGFVPLAGAASGLRQPVHADDLAACCLAMLDNPRTFDRGYDLPGGETLRYVDLVRRVARGAGGHERVLHLPLWAARGLLRLVRLLPGFSHVTPAMADRMNEDLVFDAAPARLDFGYDPRAFRYQEPQGGGDR
jgi:nucleoside-diphosphate-sugar epimerase